MKSDSFETSRNSSIAACSVAAVAGLILYKLHLSQKWDAAFVGTLTPFWYLGGGFRSKWGQASFWVAFTISFLAHLLLIWLIFGVFLRNTNTVGILVWIPVTMLEGIVLYYLIEALERRLAHLISQR